MEDETISEAVPLHENGLLIVHRFLAILLNPGRDSYMPGPGSLPCPVDVLLEPEAVPIRDLLWPSVLRTNVQVLLHIAVEESVGCPRLVHLRAVLSRNRY